MPQPRPSGSASPSLMLLHSSGSRPLARTDPQQLSAASSGLFCQTPTSRPERGQGSPSGSLGRSGLLVSVRVDRQPCHSVSEDSFWGQGHVAEGSVHGCSAPSAFSCTFCLSPGTCCQWVNGPMGLRRKETMEQAWISFPAPHAPSICGSGSQLLPWRTTHHSPILSPCSWHWADPHP